MMAKYIIEQVYFRGLNFTNPKYHDVWLASWSLMEEKRNPFLKCHSDFYTLKGYI